MPVPPADRFAELVLAWSQWLQHNRGRAAITVTKYAGHLDKLARWCSDPPDDPKRQPSCADPLALSAGDLETFAGLHAHALGLTPRARRPLVSALRGFYAWCESCGHLPSNPAANLPQPKAGRRMPRAATLQDLERLLMAPGLEDLAGYRDTALIAMLAGVGGRVSGLCGLTERSLVWSEDMPGAPRLTVRLREKGDKERLMPVPDEAAMLLRAYLEHAELARIDRALPDGDRVVFVSLRAPSIPPHDYHGERRRISRGGVQDIILRHAKRVGVPIEHAHPHALRHLYGTELAEDDVDLLQRQALLGHADPATTGIYSEMAQRKLRQVVDRSNPLAKIRAPLLDTVREIRRALRSGGTDARPRPATPQKTQSGD